MVSESLCESERVSERGVRMLVKDECFKFEKSPIRNRVIETRFPGGFHVDHPRLPRHTQVEMEPLRLDFLVDAKWQLCHIRSDENIKTEPKRLDL